MIRYIYTSRHPILLNYTPILQETVLRMISIQMWTTRWSKDTFFFLFWPQIKHGGFTVFFPLSLFLPEMRDEKQQQHRVILQYTTDRYCATVKNNWENLFSPALSFVKYLCQYSENSHWHTGNSGRGKKKDTTPSGEEKKTHKQDDIVVIRALNGSTADKATNYKG